MIEFSFGAFIVALFLLAIGKSKYAGVIFLVLFVLIMIGLGHTCEEEEREKQKFIEESNRWSNEIRQRKEYYNSIYGGVQWDPPASNNEKSEND